MIISTYSEKIDRSISKPKNTFSGSSKLSMSYPSSSSSSSSSSAVAASSGSGSGSGIVSSSSSGSDGADGASTAAPYSQIDANPRAQGETMPGQVGREEEEEEEEDDDEHMTRMRGGCRRDDVTPRDQTSGNATWGKEITCARSRAIWFRDR